MVDSNASIGSLRESSENQAIGRARASLGMTFKDVFPAYLSPRTRPNNSFKPTPLRGAA